MLKDSVNNYEYIFTQEDSTPVQLSATNDPPKALQ